MVNVALCQLNAWTNVLSSPEGSIPMNRARVKSQATALRDLRLMRLSSSSLFVSEYRCVHGTGPPLEGTLGLRSAACGGGAALDLCL